MHTQVIYAPAFQRPSGRIHLNSVQDNLVNGISTDVNLDTISTGFNDSIEDVVNHRIRPGIAGLYIVYGQIMYKNLVADKTYFAFLELNDSSPFKCFSSQQSSITGLDPLTVIVRRLLWFTNTDYVKLIAKQNSGVDTVDLYIGNECTFLEVQRVR